jgi:hypothetical protein
MHIHNKASSALTSPCIITFQHFAPHQATSLLPRVCERCKARCDRCSHGSLSVPLRVCSCVDVSMSLHSSCRLYHLSPAASVPLFPNITPNLTRHSSDYDPAKSEKRDQELLTSLSTSCSRRHQQHRRWRNCRQAKRRAPDHLARFVPRESTRLRFPNFEATGTC